MKTFLWISGLLIALSLPYSMLASSEPSAADIISRSAQALQRDWDADPQYDCTERDRTSKGSKTFQDIMIDGSPYQRLTAVNDRPLSQAQQVDEQQKLQQTIAKRKAESPDDRSQRIAKYEQDRKRDHELMQDLTKAFDFRLVGQGRMDGHEVYALDARPRPGYQPTSKETQVLTGMRGKLWIDKKTFQWVKVEAEVIHPVSIEGFLARVEPGTRFELEKKPVSDTVWLPTHFSMRSRAKILFVFGKDGSEDDTYFDYHPAKQQQ
ncbi:MAG TPA: hypothetical protein VMD78_05225 [Candidatus Baltobacteraceae bacterium]|nr:hypothetical protein [Candidatus Baltobacteraceae bacterium]